MKELYPVRLNGVGLNAIDARFHVADVEEEGPKIKVTTQSRAKYDGLRMIRRERETRRIIVHVVLWERDKMKRLEMYDKLVEWAESGGMLTLGYRNGQQIRVECTELPDISGRDWKEEVDVVFTAYDPYWRGLDPMATVSYTHLDVYKRQALDHDVVTAVDSVNLPAMVEQQPDHLFAAHRH